MWIKICGTTNHDDARLAAELGADALGFIFAPSRRQVTPAQARDLISGLPAHLEKVGVFTSGTADEIAPVVRQTGLTAVQLHMPLQPALLKDLRTQLGSHVLILQVVSLQVESVDITSELQRFHVALQEALAQPGLFAVLIDAARGSASGGLGVPIDWKAASGIVQTARLRALQAQGEATPHIVLAGGLHAENVRDAVEALRPWGVDVVSGVESSPGIKSRAKLHAFIRAARESQPMAMSFAVYEKSRAHE